MPMRVSLYLGVVRRAPDEVLNQHVLSPERGLKLPSFWLWNALTEVVEQLVQFCRADCRTKGLPGREKSPTTPYLRGGGLRCSKGKA